MTNFGTLKTKMLSKLTEAYTKQNKAEMKDILNTIKENKDFKEMYLFYEEIENKYFDDKEIAKLYVEEIQSVLKNKLEKIADFTKGNTSGVSQRERCCVLLKKYVTLCATQIFINTFV